MNNVDKAIMLAESFGADTSNFTSSYVDSIIRSSSYIGLVENVSWAQHYTLKKAVGLVEDFKALNYGVSTFQESVLLSARINYLYSVSDESFYLNPLFTYNQKPKCKSIGDLKCDYAGDKASFNEIIADDKHPLSYKAQAIEKQAEYYRREISERMNDIYFKTQNNIGLAHLVKKNVISLCFSGLIALGCLLMDIYMLVSTKAMFKNTFVTFDSTNLVSYGILVFLSFSALLILFWVMMFARVNSVYASYFYFKRFGRARAEKVVKVANKNAQKLAEYIFTACKLKTPLGDDLGLFRVKLTLKDEMAVYKKAYSLDKDRSYAILRGFFYSAFAFVILATIYTLAVYFIRKFSGA